jgi:hypothetical protein
MIVDAITAVTQKKGEIMLEVDQRAGVIGDIEQFITRYVFMPSDEATLIASLYVIHTWATEAAQATPYIYIHSPEKQSGKTRLLEILGLLVKNPMPSGSLTDAVLFRIMDEFSPTLLLDEVDAIFHGAKNEGLRGCLNAGYRRSGFIWRVVRGEPHRYKVFGPKVMCGINNGKLPDTIKDRCIAIRMRRRPKNAANEAFYPDTIKQSQEWEDLTAKITQWVDENRERLEMQRPEPITEISDRKWEISECLVAIAELMGLGDEARDAIIALCQDNEDAGELDPMQELLLDIRETFGDRDKIMTVDLMEKLGKEWNGKLLSNQLRPYGIAPKLIRIGNTTGRGYTRDQFEPVWESYL